MSPTSARRRAPLTLALAGLLATAGLAAGAPGAAVPTADAATDSWSCSLPSGGICNADRHSLRSARNYNQAGRTAGATGSTTTGSGGSVGGWAWGGGYACRVYYGDRVLYPLIKNGWSGTSTFYGTSTYGSGAASC